VFITLPLPAPEGGWGGPVLPLPNNNSNNNERFILRRKMPKLTQQIRHFSAQKCSTSAKRMTSILRHVTVAFPPARQGKTLNSHRVIDIATNTSMVLNCALVTYIMMTEDVGLPDAV